MESKCRGAGILRYCEADSKFLRHENETTGLLSYFLRKFRRDGRQLRARSKVSYSIQSGQACSFCNVVGGYVKRSATKRAWFSRSLA